MQYLFTQNWGGQGWNSAVEPEREEEVNSTLIYSFACITNNKRGEGGFKEIFQPENEVHS
jgi:hypothetical protein